MTWLLLSLGCASFPRMTRAPLEPPAAGTDWVSGAGGVRLYTSTRIPEAEPRGVIYFVLGPEIGSAELYPRFTAAAHGAGFATAVLHPRGTGYSDGLRGDIDDYGLLLSDLQEGLRQLQQRFPSKPIFLFGHSAGAALALELAATSRPNLAGLVLVNPAYKLIYGDGMGPSFGDYLVYGFNYLFRASALTVDMNNKPTAIQNAADRAEAESMRRDPLVVRYFSMRFLFAQKKVMDSCVTNAAATGAPLLLLQGAHDALVDPSGGDEILAAARTADKARVIAANGGHGSSAVETEIEELLHWLQAHCPG